MEDTALLMGPSSCWRSTCWEDQGEEEQKIIDMNTIMLSLFYALVVFYQLAAFILHT